VCSRLCVFGMILGRVIVLRFCQMFHVVSVVGCVLMLKIAQGVRGVCDGFERCCGVSVVFGICGIGREVR
jgi:hypothetical protein